MARGFLDLDPGAGALTHVSAIKATSVALVARKVSTRGIRLASLIKSHETISASFWKQFRSKNYVAESLTVIFEWWFFKRSAVP